MTVCRTVLGIGVAGVLAAGTAFVMEHHWPTAGAASDGRSASAPADARTAEPGTPAMAMASFAPQMTTALSGRAGIAPPARPVPSVAEPAPTPTAPPAVAAEELGTASVASAPEAALELQEPGAILPRVAGLLPSLTGANPNGDRVGLGALMLAGLDAARSTMIDVRETETCVPRLDLRTEPGAIIGVTLHAPCHARERVVLRHAGLAVTVATDAEGRAEALLPAFEAAGGVIATLSGNAVAVAGVTVPDLDSIERVAIQWQGEDSFALHAFAAGAGFDEPGHVWSEAPDGHGEGGASHMSFGDGNVAWPLRAEVLTWARDSSAPEIEVEAPVTDATCGRDMIAETLVLRRSGATTRADLDDLSLAMPGCGAVGGFIVLKNLFHEPNISTN